VSSWQALKTQPRHSAHRHNRPTAWLGGGNEEHGGVGRCKLCCIRLHRAGQPTEGAPRSRTACAECEVILCRYCWHQWCHEDGGHAPQHIDAPPDPERHGPPSITTPKRQRESSEQREGRHTRRRPPSPDAPPVRPQPDVAFLARACARAGYTLRGPLPPITVGSQALHSTLHIMRLCGAGTGLEPSLGHDRWRIPAMASSQGDVRSSPMAYPAVRPLPKLPLPLRPDTGPTS
jgi:hypothetical protein